MAREWAIVAFALWAVVLSFETARAAGEESPGGAIVACGGGPLPDSIRDRFVELAGGKDARILVVPTASKSDAKIEGARGEKLLDAWKARGAASVKLFHTRSRERANDPELAGRIDEATGVWFGGGDQSRVTNAYLGTAVEDALRRLLERGGVVGGSSAGAAIMSRVMITGGTDKENVGVGTGFGFLPGVVVDQHVLMRNRVNRLLGVLDDHPDLTGIAIDEGTALVVINGRWRVMGQSYVMIAHPANSPNAGLLDFRHDGDEGSVEGWRIDDRRAGEKR